MGLIDTAVRIANNVTKGLKLQATVQHGKSTGQDRYGKQIYPSLVNRLAIVEFIQKSLRTSTGELTQCRAYVVFLDPAIIVDFTDTIILPDGTSGPIVDIRGVADPLTGKRAMTEVYLG